MKLGRSSGAGTSRQKIFYFKITEGSTLLRDFVPARRKSDSAIGFYDRANSVFYGNAEASGAFTAGPTAATTWNNQNLNNGDMATEGNWNNGLPSSGVTSVIAYPVSVPLTLSRDMDTGANFYINYSGSPLDLTLNLGAGRTLSANRTYVGGPGSRATVTLASGTWSVSERFFVGDGWSDATFIVDGANSALYGSTLASGNYYIQVGNAGDGSYATSKNNLLLVRNGGLLQGGVIVGRLAKAENELCGTNTLHVTGDGSRFVSNHSLYIGCKQGLSQGIIDDHATATLSSNVILGQYLYNNNLYYVGDQNRLLVSGGASLTAAGNAYIGHTASASNLFEVADGATATVTNLYSSYASNANVRGGRAPFGNRIVVRGDGSSLTVNGGTSIGYVGGSHDDSMLIADGATFAANTISVGVYDGHSSRLTVDGAALSVQGQMTVGCTVPASNCVFEVLNGATATIGRLIFADHAPNCTAVISNATLNVSGNLDVAYSSESPNMKFVIAGRNGKVRASGQVHIFNASAKIVFHVPAEGFAETPLVVGNFENVQQGAAIEVTADERWPGGSCQTLVECANGQEFSWVAMNRLTLVCNDERLRVIRESDKIYVKKRGGFVITFR
jgi:hypothetical protein